MELHGVYQIFNDIFLDCQDVWIISDPHFGDDEITASIPGRPSSDELVKAINKKCGKTSALICLGNVGDTSYVSKLKANTKILVCGNKDKGMTNYTRKFRFWMIDTHNCSKRQAIAQVKQKAPDFNIESIKEEVSCSLTRDYTTDWRIKTDNMLFDYVFEGPVMFGQKLILSNEPIPGITWAKNIHGYVLDGPVESDKFHYNVSLDVQNYQPVQLSAYLNGGLTDIKSLSRQIIDKAIADSKKV